MSYYKRSATIGEELIGCGFVFIGIFCIALLISFFWILTLFTHTKAAFITIAIAVLSTPYWIPFCYRRILLWRKKCISHANGMMMFCSGIGKTKTTIYLYEDRITLNDIQIIHLLRVQSAFTYSNNQQRINYINLQGKKDWIILQNGSGIRDFADYADKVNKYVGYGAHKVKQQKAIKKEDYQEPYEI
ncbi:hypothetical protein [Cytobacillus firmus]